MVGLPGAGCPRETPIGCAPWARSAAVAGSGAVTAASPVHAPTISAILTTNPIQTTAHRRPGVPCVVVAFRLRIRLLPVRLTLTLPANATEGTFAGVYTQVTANASEISQHSRSTSGPAAARAGCEKSGLVPYPPDTT